MNRKVSLANQRKALFFSSIALFTLLTSFTYNAHQDITNKDYFVTYETFGGTCIETSRVKEGTVINEPERPVRDDDTFNGWYIDPEFKTSYDFTKPVTNDLTLYADWKSADTCHFNFVGTNCTINGKVIFDYDVLKGETVKFTVLADTGYTLPPNPEMPEGATYENGVIKIEKMADNYNIAMTAVPYSPPVTYSFILEGEGCTINGKSDFSVTGLEQDQCVAFTILQIEDYNDVVINKVTINDQATEDYKFSNHLFEIKVTGNIKVSAKGVALKHTITFNPNGGKLAEGAQATITVEDGQIFEKIPNIDKQKAEISTGNFVGWSLAPTGTTKIDDQYQIMFDITLYAIFDSNNIQLHFEGENCILYSHGQEYVGSGYLTLLPNQPYTFVIIVNPSFESDYLPLLSNSFTYDGLAYFNYDLPTKTVVLKTKNTNCELNVTAIAKKEKLADYSWEEIDLISRNGIADQLFKIGDEKTVSINGKDHTVMIIGFNHDDLSNNLGKAGITFQFYNPICDSKGCSLASIWNWDSAGFSNNCDYPNSSARKVLDGVGNGEVAWYEKESTTRSTKYTKPVIEMLPDDLRSHIKFVDKKVAKKNVFTYEVETYSTNLFQLAMSECLSSSSEDYANEGDIYDYFTGEMYDLARPQISTEIYNPLSEEGPNFPVVTDGKYAATNHAGYAEEWGSGITGAYYYFRSPDINNPDYSHVWYAWRYGTRTECNVYECLCSVVPAFCI